MFISVLKILSSAVAWVLLSFVIASTATNKRKLKATDLIGRVFLCIILFLLARV